MDLKSLILTSELPSKRDPLRGLLTDPAPVHTPIRPEPPARPVTPTPLQQSLLPSLLTLKSQIVHELETNLGKLLSLNFSRREAVAQYLDRLAGIAPGPTATGGNLDAAAGLRRWIEGPRSPAQNAAIQTYFEEIALILLGQAILLKAWSDRGVRSWSEADLKDLNWAMNSALKPHLPLDRESWQVAKQNLYSWYKPNPTLQREIWTTLESWRITAEGPGFLGDLLSASKKSQPHHIDPCGYDLAFFEALWKNLPTFGFESADTGPLKRQRAIFSPTLRDGAMVRTGPVALNWVGLESSSFFLMLSELMQLWWGPSSPPLWAVGTGLEAHTRDQLALNLGSPKPSLMSRISEMEACDAAIVLEERPVRGQSRGADSFRFREQADAIPYFKKLRAAGTTLGTLQACVALTKLRPGGLLWWMREEALEEREGTEALQFLLERGQLVCEWNLSEIDHALPGSRPPFPKYLYLFKREPDVEKRLNHRPRHLSARGMLRSHVELPLFLNEVFQNAIQPTSRGQWQYHAKESLSPQKDWIQKWPSPVASETVVFIETLRENSMPLASATTVRPLEGIADENGVRSWTLPASAKGVWVHAKNGGLSVQRLFKQKIEEKGEGPAFLVLVTDESSIAPLKHYLESEAVRRWLEYHCETRAGRWVLNEQIVRWIPIPNRLLQSLGLANNPSQFALPLPGEWERLASQLSIAPAHVREALERLAKSGAPETGAVGTEIFVRASRTLDSLNTSQTPLLKLVNETGRIRWGALLSILPKSECTAVTLHPSVAITGNLPLHLPIAQIVPIKTPGSGIMLATESGLFLKILSDVPVILEMLRDQLEGLQCPTWSELLQYLKLPRRLELAEATVGDVLRSHAEQTKRMRELEELLSTCRFF